jgi:RND family efflux transporter MFP subunit
VQRRSLEDSFAIAGEFLPLQEVELHAKVAGYIRHISVDIGDHVHKGQVLAVLEVPELQAQVVGSAANVRHSAEEINRAQRELDRAEANHSVLHAAAQRLHQAAEQRPGLIAQQELDDADGKDRVSEAQVEAAKAALSASREQLEVSKAGAAQFSAMSDYTRIVAPFDGVVTWRYADTGALVQAGTSSSGVPVLKVAQVSVLRLRIPVPERLAGRVHVGEPAEVRVQATGEHFDGKVARYTDALDRSTRTMQVEIDVPNTKYNISPGMYADVTLQTEHANDALVVPVNAIMRSGNSSRVLRVDQQNRVRVKQVKTGLETADLVQIDSGLSAGDRVIVGQLSTFRDGERVQPKQSGVALRAEKESE